jgi:hypothetical protein
VIKETVTASWSQAHLICPWICGREDAGVHVKHIVILILLASSCLFATDMKVKTAKRATAAGFLPAVPVKPETTLYVHDMMQREEFVGYVEGFQGPKGQEPHMAVITHCDTGIGYEIDLDGQEFREFKISRYPTREQFDKQVTTARKDEEKHTKASTFDTNETKDFYGHTAKHLVTTISRTTNFAVSENAVDGWYLDLPQPGCAPEYLRWNRGHESAPANLAVLVPVSGDRRAQVVRADPSRLPGLPQPPFIYTGFEPAGFAIQQKSTLRQTLKLDNGDKESTESVIAQEVTEFSEAPLDPALFEVPVGFKKVNKLYQHIKERRR